MVLMFSIRFQRIVVVTRHARERMTERSVSDAMLLEDAVIVKTVMHHFSLM
jgi:hypothetical protein